MEAQPIEVWVMGGFAIGVLALVVSSLREAAAMKRWPTARGRVLSSKVEQYREIVSSRTSGGSSRMTLYRPVVVYEYEVGGQRFRGDRIAQSPGLNRGVAQFAEAVAQRYPVGAAIDVRFNPVRPGDCVLEPRVPASWIAGLVIGLALLALAISRAQFKESSGSRAPAAVAIRLVRKWRSRLKTKQGAKHGEGHGRSVGRGASPCAPVIDGRSRSSTTASSARSMPACRSVATGS